MADEEDHEEIKERLTKIEGELKEIKTDLKPVLAEREFRRRLDDRVDVWIKRAPFYILVISAIIYVLYYKAVIPLLNQSSGS